MQWWWLRGRIPSDERVLAEGGRVGYSVAGPLFATSGLWALIVTMLGFMAHDISQENWWLTWLGLSILPNLVLSWRLLVLWWRVKSSHYVMTQTRIYKGSGVINHEMAQTTFDRVTDIQVHQPLLGRIFGYGTIIVESAGSGVYLIGVADPFPLSQTLQKMVKAARSGQPAPVQTVAESSAPQRPRGPERRLWQDKPRRASLVVYVVGVVVGASALSWLMFLRLGLFGEEHLPGWVWWIMALGLPGLALLLSGAHAVIVATFHRFEITTHGARKTSGWIMKREATMSFEKMTDVTVVRGPFARLFGYGTLHLNTAGSNSYALVFNGVADPERVKKNIDRVRP